MCGILGAVGKLPAEQKIKEASGALAHRGPDDVGFYYSQKESVALAHRRLSIIDLSSAGHQPMASNDGRYWLVFNGEIYNYLEIREELATDYDFKTKTDSEVLLAAYIKWGADCLQKFNGMFAFAIWDKRDKKLFCARDRMGVKPFFYSFNNGQLLFASEIKGLLALGVKARADERTIFEYLNYGLYDHSDRTFFQGVNVLPSGCFAVWQNNDFKIQKYWDLADRTQNYSALSGQEVVDQLGALLADAIKLRFRSDVPVGLNLSSGLDSNSLYYYAKQITGGNLDIFSMCLASEEYNECGLIEQSLSSGNKKFWHTCYLEPAEVLAGAGQMNKIQDQPYGGIPTIAYESLVKLARDAKTTVLLEGQGVDEILAGYSYYKRELQNDAVGGKKAVDTLSYSQDMTKLINQDILSADFAAEHEGEELVFPAPFDSHLLNAQYRDICYTKLPRVLRFNDHITMRYGRELRLPFLDYRIVEFCFWLPAEHKIQNGSQKFALRQLMKGIIPDDVQGRQKKAFGAIQSEWFRQYFGQEIGDLLASDSFRARNFWNHKKLAEEVEKFFKGELDNSFFIWQCFNLELWFKEFID